MQSNTNTIISLSGVTKAYRTVVGDYLALKDVDLAIGAGEFVGIIGKSGSGKSTLLNMITGIDRPSSGEVHVLETPVHTLSESRMSRWRGKTIGIVFQFFQLLPTISVIENVMLPMDFCRTLPARERGNRAMQLLGLVELEDQAYKLPTALSGGQQQRVAIARALANDPPIVIADEPSGNLDSKTADSVFELFRSLVSGGKTIIVVTHDTALAKKTDRTALIADGEIVNEFVSLAMPALTTEQLLSAAREFEPRQYAAGAMILAEGTHSDAFFIVSEGLVEVILPRPGQSEVIAVELGPGKFFGEMEFFHGRRNMASVRASRAGPVEVLAIRYEELDKLLVKSEATRVALRLAADRHAQENAQRRGKRP